MAEVMTTRAALETGMRFDAESRTSFMMTLPHGEP